MMRERIGKEKEMENAIEMESVKETERGIEIGIKLTVHKFAMQTNRVIHIKKWEITQFMHLNAGKLV